MPDDSTACGTAAAQSGMVLVVSGPSASGKSTLVWELLQGAEFPLTFSVSATSRAPRPAELDGRHYHFMTRERFRTLQSEGAFLEWAEVYGHLYGTLRQPVEQVLQQGRWVLLEIDVQGHRQVKKQMPEAVSFFVRASAAVAYERRMRSRGTESDEAIADRRAVFQAELASANEFDFQIVNDSLPQALRTIRTLLWGLTSLGSHRHA